MIIPGTWRRVRVTLLLLFIAVLPAQGRTIQWFCDSGGSKQFSAGSAWDDSMRFELGVFKGGFVPTSANRNQWAANWTAAPAQRVTFFPPTNLFSGSFTVAGNAVPFLAGAKAYVWGFTDEVENGQWILARAANWLWPTPDPFNPFDLEWNLGTATEVLAGTVHPSGSPFLLRSESIPLGLPPPTSWAQWQQAELQGEPEDGPSDDPDHDGLSNLEEYAAGTSPLASSSRESVTSQLISIGADRHLAISVPLRVDRQVVLEIGVSSNLVNWNYLAAKTVLVEQSLRRIVYRSIEPLDSGSREFLRARFTLAP